jgi:predicted transcriptional regulator
MQHSCLGKLGVRLGILGKEYYWVLKAEGRGLGRRGWSSITAELLEAVLQPERKMRVMYRANLNYARFRRHFTELVEKGFIEKIADSEGKPMYKISERGRTLLAALKKVKEISSSDKY